MTFYIGLLHYPVYNKRRKIIASAITNLDLHDLARLAKTYGAERFYVITPLVDQQELARRICQHWVSGFGARYNKHRQEAMSLISVIPTLEKSMEEIRDREGELPALMVTDAGRNKRERITYEAGREIVASSRAIMLLFGTAWGIAQELMGKADYVLAPIMGVSQYNHLSVRAAAAITLDRLFSRFAESQGDR
jgi:hypothetical protein